jgi:hypothetical protein
VGSAAIDRDPVVANAHDAPSSYRERAISAKPAGPLIGTAATFDDLR